MKNIFFSRAGIIIVGAIIGIGAALLQYFGNPPNMGICVACFERDIAGALGLHRADVVQYLRPEIIGFVLGAFLMAAFAGEFRPRGGSSPLIRFFLGLFAMIGALVFLGCPWRALLRLAGGDGNAILGIIGINNGNLCRHFIFEKRFQPWTFLFTGNRQWLDYARFDAGAPVFTDISGIFRSGRTDIFQRQRPRLHARASSHQYCGRPYHWRAGPTQPVLHNGSYSGCHADQRLSFARRCDCFSCFRFCHKCHPWTIQGRI